MGENAWTKYPLAVPVLGVPIRGKHNPYLVLVSRNDVVEVRVDVEESSKPIVEVEGWPRLGWRLQLPLNSFVEVLSDRLEQPLRTRIEYRCVFENVSSASIYAAITLEIVRSVAEAGGYEMTVDEVLKATASIDAEAGVDLDYVNAMRTAITRSHGIVYREGEEPIDMELSVELELVGEEDTAGDFSNELSEEVVNALTRFAGVSTATAIARLRDGESFSEVFRVGARIENALYYMLYGLQPPEEGCKWVPSLASGFAVCLPGKGLGVKVALH